MANNDPLENNELTDEQAWKAYKDECQRMEDRNREWRIRWPNHCRECGGWGRFYEPGRLSGPPENCYPPEEWPCEHRAENICHRCGGELENIDDNLKNEYDWKSAWPKCKVCGWQFDDGLHCA